jgi:hypothetical protein
VRRLRPSACFALAAYFFGALALPVLHRAHHAARGADHTHGAAPLTHSHGGDGTESTNQLVRVPDAAAANETEASAHAAFDADLAFLSLTEVATAGISSVDCTLASLTLAVCDESLPADHARGFGDLLLAHHAPPAEEPFDPEHGRGSLEHGSAPLMAAAVFWLPPPPTTVVAVEPALIADAPRAQARAQHPPRGPPALSIV